MQDKPTTAATIPNPTSARASSEVTTTGSMDSRYALTSNLLLERSDSIRLTASRQLRPAQQAALGQYFTPASVAHFMAGLLNVDRPILRLLDAGAGTGSLAAAAVTRLLNRQSRPRQIEIVAYEIDPELVDCLSATYALCEELCTNEGVAFSARIYCEDFLSAGTAMATGEMFAPERLTFDAAILNPPYRKINTNSRERQLLRRIGLETSNIYTAFLAVASQLLSSGGELVAITPRSFCNGSYFRPFRYWFLRQMTFRHIHVFESRTSAFRDDAILQENIIFHAVKGPAQPGAVTISSSMGPTEVAPIQRQVPYTEVVHPNDPELMIHLVPEAAAQQVSKRLGHFSGKLADLSLDVSTGRVVEFRAKAYLRDQPGNDTVPLIYPSHFHRGYVSWPGRRGRNPNALALAPHTEPQTLPAGVYVLVKRFSSKEERRRIVAAIYDPARVGSQPVAFENHLNVFHEDGRGVPLSLARGLAIYLNSTLIDQYFRQFSGHTQVNATDLRILPYPSRRELEVLGSFSDRNFPPQEALDNLVEELLSQVDD